MDKLSTPLRHDAVLMRLKGLKNFAARLNRAAGIIQDIYADTDAQREKRFGFAAVPSFGRYSMDR